MKIKINDKTYQIDKPEATLFDLYKQNIPVNFQCRIRICGVCMIYVKSGLENLNDKNKLEKQLTGKNKQRLGCQCIFTGDVELGTTD